MVKPKAENANAIRPTSSPSAPPTTPPKDRHPPPPQLFVPHLADLALRDQRETMERPFFSLSKRKRLKPVDYTSPDGSIWVKVEGHQAYGMATIWDADILMWAAAILTEMKERGIHDLPRTLRFHPYNLLKSIRRDVGGRQYKLLRDSLDRLQTTTIQTNIRAQDKKRTARFSWLDKWSEEIDETTGETQGIAVTLSDWVYQGIVSQGHILAVHPDYFSLKGGLERCLYRIARKHTGRQTHGWKCSLSKLYEKTGSECSLRRFKFEIDKIILNNPLPEYSLKWEKGKPLKEPMIGIQYRPDSREAIISPNLGEIEHGTSGTIPDDTCLSNREQAVASENGCGTSGTLSNDAAFQPVDKFSPL